MFDVFSRLADLLAFRGLGLDPATHLGAAVHFFLEDTAKIFVMGLFRSVVSLHRVRVRFAAREVAVIVKRVWLYVLIGIAIGAGLHGYVPADLVADIAGPGNSLAVPLAGLMGIPLYSNATGVIPVAEALLSKGVPVGTVLALMMSVVAISLPEFVILRKVIQPRGLALFGGFLAVAFIAVGLFFNVLLG